jgi:exodeoxyribonuclease V alpha subunit
MSNEAVFSRIDFAFAEFLAKQTKLKPEDRKTFKEIVAKLSASKSQGHSCISITDKDKLIIEASGVSGTSGSEALIIENKTLYMQRYWLYECQLAENIKCLIAHKIKIEQVDELLNQYFPCEDSSEVDWQKLAAEAVINNSFTIITGGPGTGKTTTVVKILALLQELSIEHYLNIGLVAPTGKAAMRLQESILKSKSDLNCSNAIKKEIPEKVQTIHRLLGARQFSPYFKYNDEKKLPFDLVVVDEASMIDLPLMTKLLSALAVGSRVILLGDKDQLSSVEIGSVLSDLSQALPEQTNALNKSFRFSGNIKQLATDLNLQNSFKAWQLINAGHKDVSLLSLDLIDYIVEKQLKYFELINNKADFIDIYTEFNQFQVLCATRKGALSIDDINHRVLNKLKECKKVNSSSDWYIGRPVLITQNSPALNLYNGDIGICLVEENKLMVYFLMPDSSVKKYLPARLPHCETVFAMTIHKSQGSEFEEVLLVLPEKITAILTKELIYTGITRARKKVQLMSSKAVFIEAVNRKVERNSGLIKRIRE